jgi:hypothetical protein
MTPEELRAVLREFFGERQRPAVEEWGGVLDFTLEAKSDFEPSEEQMLQALDDEIEREGESIRVFLEARAAYHEALSLFEAVATVMSDRANDPELRRELDPVNAVMTGAVKRFRELEPAAQKSLARIKRLRGVKNRLKQKTG